MFNRILLVILILALFFIQNSQEIQAQDISTEIKTSITANNSINIKPYVLNINDNIFEANLFINDKYRTMISSRDIKRIFNCTIEWSDSNQIYIIKNDKYWCFTLNNNTYVTNNGIEKMDTSPTILNFEMYIPLRYIAQELGYYITFCPSQEQYYLSSIDNLQKLTCKNQVISEFSPPSNLPLWGILQETKELSPLYDGQKLIGGYYTTLLSNSASRTNNIKLAAQSIDNIVIPPGKVFSFNKILGERTADKGYQEAPIFVNQKVVPGIGGGICQVSSTIYNSALTANLKILERHPHTLKVAYVPPNRDASVSWGVTDFKFLNTYDFPIRLMVKVVGKYVVTGIFDARE